MIFSIRSFNKNMDMYEVVSDTNELRVVSALQIVTVMAQGYEFNNAYLTRKGFAIKALGRTKYIQLNNISPQLNNAIINRLNTIKITEDTKKQQMTEAIKKPQAVIRKKITIPKDYKPRDTDAGTCRKMQPIYYRGTIYYSPNELCAKHGQNPEKFMMLYNKGYSVEEALGLKPLRPEEELVSHKQIQHMLDSMAIQRGEF